MLMESYASFFFGDYALTSNYQGNIGCPPRNYLLELITPETAEFVPSLPSNFSVELGNNLHLLYAPTYIPSTMPPGSYNLTFKITDLSTGEIKVDTATIYKQY